ncbi:hypothetical protein IAI17_43915, partial [Escherichia coli]|nr:hypothetical protein [Escherichia coli]
MIGIRGRRDEVRATHPRESDRRDAVIQRRHIRLAAGQRHLRAGRIVRQRATAVAVRVRRERESRRIGAL